MNNLLEKLENLERLMDKYDLYQEGDEVGVALAELRQAIVFPVNGQITLTLKPESVFEKGKPVVIKASFAELKRMGIDVDLENKEGLILQEYGDGWSKVQVNENGEKQYWDIRSKFLELEEN